MTGREHFKSILAGRSDHCGFWHGNPHEDSLPMYCRHFNVQDDFGLSRVLGDTLVWVTPEASSYWKHPSGKPLFDVTGGRVKKSLNEGGTFAECEDTAENRAVPVA